MPSNIPAPRGRSGIALSVSVAAVMVLTAVVVFFRPGGSLSGAAGTICRVDRILADAAAGPVADGTLACVEEVRLARGEAPATALQQAGVGAGAVHALLTKLGEAVNVRAIRPSDSLLLYRTRDGEPVRLDYQRSPERRVVVEQAGAGYAVRTEEIPVDRYVRRISGTVAGNLYESLLEAGGDPELVLSFSDLFAWSFDFLTDTRNGDAFELLVEERRIDGERIGFGRVLAGRYHPASAEARMEAFHFASGETDGYFDGQGRSVRRQFLKSPLNFRRISSHFSHSRMHPILKKPRPHLGVDYAAASGTPVVALGNGKVTFAGWIRGFGNTVKIKHNGNYLTQYAHLKGFARGIRAGARVSQEQVIGYVGSTGLSTGPHLDFRVQKNGAWINPLSLKGGSAEPLAERHRDAFGRATRQLAALLREMAPGAALAWDDALGERAEGALASVRLDTPPGS